MTPAAVDYGDVQGLVRYGYAHMTEARFLLLESRIARGRARVAARGAGHDRRPGRCPGPRRRSRSRSRGEGLEALGVPAGVLARFLRRVPRRPGGRGEPLAPAGRRRPEQPGGLAVGRPRERPPPDGPALRRAGAARALDADGHARSLGAAPSRSSRARCRRSSTASSHSGSSTASASRCWTGSSAGSSTEDATSWSTATSLALGEVLLGYPNEYGKYTDRPLVGRSDERGAACCRPTTRPTGATSAGTAATSSCASSARTFTASGSSCAGRRTATPRRGAPWPRRWWAAR